MKIKVQNRSREYKYFMKEPLKSALLRHDRMVPRYTSYPTAPHFIKGPAQEWYAEQLSSIPDGSDISLYIHVPFCPKLCWFCGCHTRIVNKYTAVEEYIRLLFTELDRILPYVSGRGIKISHLHFGGGSPTILKAADFRKLIKKINNHFDWVGGAEIAIEIDPRNVDAVKIRSYAEIGVNRVSLGIQDFDEQVMEAVNRPQSYDLDKQIVGLCRDNGIDRINLDLMYGLPFQTQDTMKKCAELALSLQPDRIALFGYAHVPWLKKHMRLMNEDHLPTAAQRVDLFEDCAQIIEDAGYLSIGIDHFASDTDGLSVALRNHKLRRNFQGYTDDCAKYLIGLGASAISHFNGTYSQNATFIPQYRDQVAGGNFAVEKYCVLTDIDKLHAAIISEMMCYLKVNPFEIADSFGLASYDFSSIYEQLWPLQKDNLIVIDGQGAIHATVRQATRLVCACFDMRLTQSTMRRHVSSA